MAAIDGVDVMEMTFEEDDLEEPELLFCFRSDVGLGLRTLSKESRAPPTPLLPDELAPLSGISEFCSRILLGICTFP